MTKIKQVKYFRLRINGVSLFHQVVIAMRIKPCENLTGEYLTSEKFLVYGIQYCMHVLHMCCYVWLHRC